MYSKQTDAEQQGHRQTGETNVNRENRQRKPETVKQTARAETERQADTNRQTETRGCPNRDRQSRQIETWSCRDSYIRKKNIQRAKLAVRGHLFSLSAEALSVESHYCSMTQMNGTLV